MKSSILVMRVLIFVMIILMVDAKPLTDAHHDEARANLRNKCTIIKDIIVFIAKKEGILTSSHWSAKADAYAAHTICYYTRDQAERYGRGWSNAVWKVVFSDSKKKRNKWQFGGGDVNVIIDAETFRVISVSGEK